MELIKAGLGRKDLFTIQGSSEWTKQQRRQENQESIWFMTENENFTVDIQGHARNIDRQATDISPKDYR